MLTRPTWFSECHRSENMILDWVRQVRPFVSVPLLTRILQIYICRYNIISGVGAIFMRDRHSHFNEKVVIKSSLNFKNDTMRSCQVINLSTFCNSSQTTVTLMILKRLQHYSQMASGTPCPRCAHAWLSWQYLSGSFITVSLLTRLDEASSIVQWKATWNGNSNTLHQPPTHACFFHYLTRHTWFCRNTPCSCHSSVHVHSSHRFLLFTTVLLEGFRWPAALSQLQSVNQNLEICIIGFRSLISFIY